MFQVEHNRRQLAKDALRLDGPPAQGLILDAVSVPESAPKGDGPRLLALFRRVTTSGGFVGEIDGLRFVAIFVVVLFHLAIGLSIKAPESYARPAGGWVAALAWNGFRGVELFFVISGFILALPFAAHFLIGGPRVSLKAYFLRRVTRLEPPYLIVMLLFYALLVGIRGRDAHDLLPHLAASLGYLHSLLYGYESTINNVAWSLEVEIQFYLLAPLLALLFAIRGKAARRATLVAICAASTALSWLCLHPGQRASLTIARFLHFFLVGFLLADVYLTDWAQKPSRSLRWDLVSLVGWPLLVFAWSLGAAPAAGLAPASEPALTAFFFPVAVFFLYCAAFRGQLTNRFFTNPWITAIGGMCYSIYLLHNPVLNTILARTKGLAPASSYAANLSLQLAVVTPLLLLPCALYFLCVEKPCMRRDWPRRLLDRISARPAAPEAR
jgi:peptidoglycan/LPS O-acetylase OafA/YrhL